MRALKCRDKPCGTGLDQVEAAVEITGEIRVRHIGQASVRAGARILQKQPQRRARLRGRDPRRIAQVLPIHRQNQVEVVEIARLQLPGAQAGQVIAPRPGRGLHRAIGRLADMPAAGAGAVGIDSQARAGGQMAKHPLGGGGTTDIAKAEKQDTHDNRVTQGAGMEKIVILTGAGISAESGLRTFRDAGGLWEGYRIEDVATPEAFARDPALVHDFYNMRRAAAVAARPNAAHAALARLEAAGRHEVLIVTQNVDDLHERAGSAHVIHMHGALAGALCAACGHRWAAPAVMAPQDPCPACARPATRPDIVWFGEMPYQMDRIWQALRQADLFVSIGTSGNVYPAAAFVQDAARAGARTLELNLEPSLGTRDFDDARLGPASRIVPDWVDSLLRA